MRRSQCVNGMRPCPWISCRYHLMVDIVRYEVKVYADDLHDLEETCTLDLVTKTGGMSLDSIASYFCVSRERVRQIVDKALRKVMYKKL